MLTLGTTAALLVGRAFLLEPQNCAEHSEDHLGAEKTDVIVFCLFTLHYKANLLREAGVQNHE